VSITVNGYPCDSDIEVLEQVRRLLWRLTPSHRNPERFHEDKSEINGALTQLIKFAAGKPALLRARVNGASTEVVQATRIVAKAEAVFQPPVAPPEPQQMARHVTPQIGLPLWRKGHWGRPRVHRYPMPPRRLGAQGKLL
jgi:hypothetical protein